MKRSELKQIIREVIEESKLVEESLYDIDTMERKIAKIIENADESDLKQIHLYAYENGVLIDKYGEVVSYSTEQDFINFFQDVTGETIELENTSDKDYDPNYDGDESDHEW